MKEKYNLKSIIAALVVLVIGICGILLDIFVIKTSSNVWISIGCSLIASALVILMNNIFVDKIKYRATDEWKIDKIYETRAEKNADSDPKIETAKYCIDGVAFGLKSFRAKQTERIKKCLSNGVNIRIITMNPDSKYVQAREQEEKEAKGQLKNTINQLVEWADELNSLNYKGKIIVKGYSCMTLDFYWRIDDEVYIGPYWYGIGSQQTITYRFLAGGKGFQQYTAYFENLWNDNELTAVLTK